jgi:predicted ATP-dependent Lon-type protease
MDPATSAVELNNPSVCTIAGAWCVVELAVLEVVSSGVDTALVLSEFKPIVSPNFEGLLGVMERDSFSH